jgi:hypothetical protein
MLHTQLAALALAAAAVIATGCGSSKTESTTTAASTTTPATTATTPPPANTTPAKVATGAPLTHAQWISEADAICASTAAKLSALSARTQAALALQLPQAAAYYTAESEELGKLVPPKPMAHDWTLIVSDIHLLSGYTDQAAQYIKTTHKIGGPALAKATRLEIQELATAKRDGFNQCAKPA